MSGGPPHWVALFFRSLLVAATERQTNQKCSTQRVTAILCPAKIGQGLAELVPPGWVRHLQNLMITSPARLVPTSLLLSVAVESETWMNSNLGDPDGNRISVR